MSDQRYLIVNADDFGLSAGVNAGILGAHLRGIVTSASLMVRWPGANEAATLTLECPRLSLGLHLDLGEWAYRQGTWVPLYQVVDTDDRAAVEREVRRQFDQFCDLTGTIPSHLDSHQHVHRQQPVKAALLALAEELNVPLRHESPHVHYCGDFYGQTSTGEPLEGALDPASLVGIFGRLAPGVTELGCHPGFDDELDTMYARERRREAEVLCNFEVRAALADLGVKLRSFHGLSFADAENAAAQPALTSAVTEAHV